jgi:hypothetical protein
MFKTALATAFLSLALSSAFAAGPGGMTAAGGGQGHGNKSGPCEQIENDCKGAGYVAGEAGQGKGLWWDCMCPLIAPGFAEPSKNVLSVPSDQGLVGNCQKHPHGQRIVSRCQQMLAKKNANQANKAQNGNASH